MLRIVCISDTHSMLDQVAIPDGDVLVHAGDLTGRGSINEIKQAAESLKPVRDRFREVVVIAGNHDFGFEEFPDVARDEIEKSGCIYLHDSGVEIDGLHFWGSPWQPYFGGWAFNLDRGEPLREKWALIPQGTDVLVTHGPPFGILDRVRSGQCVGCEELTERVKVVRPQLHVFGHIHEDYGMKELDGTTYVNAATCTLRYTPTNKPVVVEINRRGE